MNGVVPESINDFDGKETLNSDQKLNDLDPFLKKVDAELNLLIPHLKKAFETKSVIVVLQMWKRIDSLALLPFHLHLRWTDLIDSLPLTTTFGYIPIIQQDWAYTQTRIYKVSDALSSRKEARIRRVRDVNCHRDDFKIPDWEQGCFNHLNVVAETLAGNSFVCLDSVNAINVRKRGGRPVLGRLANRSGFRPYILIPTKNGISEISAQSFEEVDLLIVNLQGIRGKSTLRSISNALYKRGENRPTLIVATSPSDLIMLELEKLVKNYSIVMIGDVPSIDNVSVTSVGPDRPYAERDFEFAFEELRGKGDVDDYLLNLAKNAWWATRQSVASYGVEPELQYVVNTYEKGKEKAPESAKLLRPGLDLILKSADDKQLSKSRRDSVISAVLNSTDNLRTIIFARGNGIVELKNNISSQLEIKPYELSDLGIKVHSPLYWNFDRDNDLAIVAGYYGHLTIDAILASSPTKVKLILDPLEARAAWQWIRKLIKFFKDINFESVIFSLEKLLFGIEQSIPINLRSFVTDVDLNDCFLDIPINSSENNSSLQNYKPIIEDNVIIRFTNGTFIEVGKNSRFDVLTSIGQNMKTIPAHKLQFGDEIILLEENSRALFSDKLFETLDNSLLKNYAADRFLWLSIIKSIRLNRKPNLRRITERMAELGQPVEYNTVRLWINHTDESSATIPSQKASFLALAKALDITLPESLLIQKFQGIRRWRVGHRRAGRNLSRTIRAAYTNRLDATSKARLKREWGIDVLQLIQGAYVATVDEIISK